MMKGSINLKQCFCGRQLRMSDKKIPVNPVVVVAAAADVVVVKNSGKNHDTT